MIDWQFLNYAIIIIFIVGGYIINPIMCICFSIDEDESVFLWFLASLACPIAGFVWLGERRRKRRLQRRHRC